MVLPRVYKPDVSTTVRVKQYSIDALHEPLRILVCATVCELTLVCYFIVLRCRTTWYTIMNNVHIPAAHTGNMSRIILTKCSPFLFGGKLRFCFSKWRSVFTQISLWLIFQN